MRTLFICGFIFIHFQVVSQNYLLETDEYKLSLLGTHTSSSKSSLSELSALYTANGIVSFGLAYGVRSDSNNSSRLNTYSASISLLFLKQNANEMPLSFGVGFSYQESRLPSLSLIHI